jgi:hypothetical protein
MALSGIMWRVPLSESEANSSPPHREHSPSLNSEKVSESKELKRWVDNYLGMGEWVMDQSVAILGSSSWFERRR